MGEINNVRKQRDPAPWRRPRGAGERRERGMGAINNVREQRDPALGAAPAEPVSAANAA